MNTTTNRPTGLRPEVAGVHAADGDEALVADRRAALRPSEVVEQKLRSLLKSGPLPLSHVRTAGLPQGHSRG